MSMSFTVKNKSAKKTLNSSGPSIEPCGTPNVISNQVLYVFSIFVLCFLFDK